MLTNSLSINFNLFFQGLQNHGFGQNDKLVQFKFLWLHLSKLTQNIGRSMAATYSIYTLYSFAFLVVESYQFLVSIGKEFTTISLVMTSAILADFVIIYALCTHAQSATEEVSFHK
jgi:hypothetical protein